jgi:ADP-dependent NAD(P)H-hydrate dehydratase / NAD(P)H-hydrate epimerase
MKINSSKLWIDKFPIPKIEGNKYDRGHLAIIGANIGNGSTGATKLASYAGLRAGAGLVSIICNQETAPIYASSMMSIMIKATDDIDKIIDDKRIETVLIGPGNGLIKQTKLNVLKALSLRKKVIIDADAISIFQDDPNELFEAINSEVILTPHLGEFKRLFQLKSNLIDSALAASSLSQATILLKGRDTIICSPNGDYIINQSAPRYLATAGSGDVLAGLISGFVAQGVSSVNACTMATYIHSRAAKNIGAGLIAEDLLLEIPKVLNELLGFKANS